jgi:hypothetical protein
VTQVRKDVSCSGAISCCCCYDDYARSSRTTTLDLSSVLSVGFEQCFCANSGILLRIDCARKDAAGGYESHKRTSFGKGDVGTLLWIRSLLGQPRVHARMRISLAMQVKLVGGWQRMTRERFPRS